MTTHEILFEHRGEISYTSHDPVAVWTGQVDLNETKGAILSNDDWRQVSVNRYSTAKVELPYWLSPEEWLHSTVAWKYTWGMGVEQSWPENWQRALLRLSSEETYACAKLLKTKSFRSEFRAKMRMQLVAWLEGHSDFAHPFSPRQLDAVLGNYGAREAKRQAEYLYRSR